MIRSVVKIILAILLILCLFKMPYSYYELAKFLCMIGFALLAYDEKSKLLYIVWIASTILINPFFKIPLDRTFWNILDIIWAIIFIGSILFDFFSIRMAKKQSTIP